MLSLNPADDNYCDGDYDKNACMIADKYLPGPQWKTALEAIEDLRSVDPEKAKGLMDLLEYDEPDDIEDIFCLDFTVEFSFPRSRTPACWKDKAKWCLESGWRLRCSRRRLLMPTNMRFNSRYAAPRCTMSGWMCLAEPRCKPSRVPFERCMFSWRKHGAHF